MILEQPRKDRASFSMMPFRSILTRALGLGGGLGLGYLEARARAHVRVHVRVRGGGPGPGPAPAHAPAHAPAPWSLGIVLLGGTPKPFTLNPKPQKTLKTPEQSLGELNPHSPAQVLGPACHTLAARSRKDSATGAQAGRACGSLCPYIPGSRVSGFVLRGLRPGNKESLGFSSPKP